MEQKKQQENINPLKLQKWPKKEKLAEAFNQCFGFHEKFFSHLPCSQEIGDDAKYDFRESLYAIANNLDLQPECKHMVMQDDDQSSAIMVLIRSVKKLEDGSPFIEVAYTHNTKSSLNHSILQQISRACQGMKLNAQIKSSRDEQKLMLKFLKRNAEKMDQQYVKTMKKTWLKDIPIFEPSFVSIIKPPNDGRKKPEIPIKLCAVCKEPASKTCSRCLSSHYCSESCQNKHWKAHKKVCRKTPKATEDSVVLPVVSEELNGVFGNHFTCTVNRYKGTLASQRTDQVPGNYAGDDKFIVKIQAPMTSGSSVDVMGGAMLLYDELQTMRRMILNKEDCYDQLQKLVRKNKQYMGLKMYMYAQREGQNLRIFLEDIPPQKQPW